jgi:hypothetical protein
MRSRGRCVAGRRVLSFLGRAGRPLRPKGEDLQLLYAAGSTRPDGAMNKRRIGRYPGLVVRRSV